MLLLKERKREAVGDKAPPKSIPKRVDNQQVCDETTVDPTDEEVAYDGATDEFTCYFNILPRFSLQHQIDLMGEQCNSDQFCTILPNSHGYYKRGLALEKKIFQSTAKEISQILLLLMKIVKHQMD